MGSQARSLPANTPILVVGAGAMGAGIAQVAATAGHPVILFDAQPSVAERAIAAIAADLDRAVASKRLTGAESTAIKANLRTVSRLAECSATGLVIEAIREDIEVKRQLFSDLEMIVSSEAILASNTSSLSITALGSQLKRPGRFVGLHFFNPATRMKLVEVIGGIATDDDILNVLDSTMKNWGKTPVRAKSTPGFIVNRVARPFYAEGLRVLEESASDPATLDAIMREAAGFRMGPFELMDLIGNDVNYAVTCSVYQAYYNDPRFTPSILQRELVEAGHYGRKTGRGWYNYLEPPTNKLVCQPPLTPPADVAICGDLGPGQPLSDRLQASGLAIRKVTGTGEIIADGVRIALTNGQSATERAWAGNHKEFVNFDYVSDWTNSTRIAIAAADQATSTAIDIATGLFQSAGMSVLVLPDIPGLLALRTMVMLANEAAEAAYRGVAAPIDIDRAMQVGANYPVGPLEWADSFGVNAVLAILDNLARAYGEDRYRASMLLRRAVAAGGRLHAQK